MRRRTFLMVGGGGLAAAALGGLAAHIGAGWWDQRRSASLRVLSDEEAEIFGMIADTLFPGEPFVRDAMPPATATQIVEFYDAYLASIDVDTQRLLRLLLHAIDDGAVFADAGTKRFRFRPQHEREEILRAWDRSWFSARRGAWTSLKLFIAMGYTEHPAVLKACGIEFLCRTEPETQAGSV